MSASDDNYLAALEEVQYINGVGFLKAETTGLTQGDLVRKLIAQNNLLIQLLVNLHKKVDTLRAEVAVLKNREIKPAEVSFPEDIIKKLEGFHVGNPKASSQKTGTFFTFKDPYVILEEEKEKLKKK